MANISFLLKIKKTKDHGWILQWNGNSILFYLYLFFLFNVNEYYVHTVEYLVIYINSGLNW